MHTTVLVFDPGEHTGWCCATSTDATCSNWQLVGGTADKDHRAVAELIYLYQPDIVVFERFNLYPGMAKTLSWNSFYPCEVIGVIRYLCMKRGIHVYEQAPSIKKFSGGLQQDWKQLRENSANLSAQGVTEHSKDAYLHWKYFERNGLRNALSLLRKKGFAEGGLMPHGSVAL